MPEQLSKTSPNKVLECGVPDDHPFSFEEHYCVECICKYVNSGLIYKYGRHWKFDTIVHPMTCLQCEFCLHYCMGNIP